MFNSKLSIDEFLQDYWQQKPFLFRNAFPNIKPPLSADELAGLACEESSNARLIIESINKPNWTVEHSPIDEARFQSLPATNWTLLVSDIENHVPEARDLLNAFSFIPDWRVDDLMMSYAVKGGSVGPHNDAYDVFLLQAEGQRHWNINLSDKNNDEIIEDIELRILKSFESESDWILNPGDMLYLPPNIAHHGVAVNNCITCSIGFRTPSIHNLVSEFAEALAEKLPQSIRYTDARLKQQSNPGEITAEVISDIQHHLLTHLQVDNTFVQQWFGEYITSSNQTSQYQDSTINNVDAVEQLNDFEFIFVSPSIKLLFTKQDNNALLFADGQSFPTSLDFSETLCKSHKISCTNLLKNIKTDTDKQTLNILIDRGYFYSDE